MSHSPSFDGDDTRRRLRAAIVEAGTAKAWAEAHSFSQAYVSDVLSGARLPGPRILAALGLRREVRIVPASEGGDR